MAASRPVATFPRPEDILARLAKEALSPLYLFHGEEAYLIDQAVAQIGRRMPDSSEVRVFYAGQDSLDVLLEVWGAPSLFAAQDLVVLKSVESLKAPERERLAREAELRDATQPLVACAHGRVDLTQKFFALCAKKGFVAEFRPPFATQLPAWSQRFARERNVRLSEEAGCLLAEHVGPDLLALATEMDKLVAFVFPETHIDVEAVVACTGNLHQHSAFDLADALGQRDDKRAVGLLRQVLMDERRALPILHALVAHFRRLWQVKDLQERGVSESQIERAVGLRGQRLRGLVSQSRLFTAVDLRRGLHHMAGLDRTLKSTRIPALILFDSLVFEVCKRPG